MSSENKLFGIECILEDIDVRLCSRIESGVKQLLAIVTDCGDIVLHYTYGELPVVIKRLPWFTETCKMIRAICFDPTATWLLAVSLDSSLYIIPALSLVDKKQRIDCKWSVNDLTPFPKHSQSPNAKPLSIVWWQTLDCNQNALVGYDDGAIGLISLTDGRCLATCNVSDSVVYLYLCQDNTLDCVSLLINGESGQQWRLMLEQHSTGYIWPPENNANEGGVSSRLQTLKQMSVDKFVSLKQRFSDGKTTRRDSQTSDSASESSHSESLHTGPELLPHLCDTFFAPQYATNRYLFSAFYKPTSLLTVHAVDIESAPLFVYKLNTKTNYLLLTNQLIYAVNDDLDILSVISTQLSECRLDGDNEFNPESLLVQFKFEKDGEKILNIFKLTDTTSFNEVKSKETITIEKMDPSAIVLPATIEELKFQRPKVDTCIVVTNRAVYKVILSCSPLKQFVTLVTEEFNLEKAEKLAVVFGLNLQDLLEGCGDLLISRGSYHQGLIIYKQAKVHLLRRVLKLASTGDSRAILKFIHLCLSASKVEMSTATKFHMGNFAVMAYANLVLKYTGHMHNTTNKDFMNFLRFEEFYDQILAVNVACQSGLWNIITLLAKSRGLQPESVVALSKVIQSVNAPQMTNHDFLIALSEPSLTQSLLIYPTFGQKILNYIRTNIEYFPVDILHRFFQQLDPSQPSALPIMKKLFTNRKVSSSLESTLDTTELENLDSIIINAKDFIETFIWIVTELVAKASEEMYNIDLLNPVELPEEAQDSTILKKFPDLRSLSCGYEHAAVIRNGNVYTMGVANSGCLGFGPILTQSSPPKLVHTLAELKVKVLNVSCGRKHCLAVTDFGVYAWGSNFFGQLGIGNLVQESPYPQIITSFYKEKVVDVAAGQYHSMALTATGLVYTWGWGIYGQLGHGNSDNEYYPRSLNFKETVIQIAAGHAHSLILTNEGKLYGFGSNAFGQLDSSTIQSNKTNKPILISILPDNCIPVKKIATAHFHNIAVCKNEEVYTWGASPQEVRMLQSKYAQKLNESGEKGHEPWKSSTHIFSGSGKEPVHQVAVGFRHSAILHGGKLLICKNMIDEVSLPKSNEQDNLGIISKKYMHVSCGPDFTIAMDHSGKLLAWGNSAMAQTLLGKTQDDDSKRSDGKVVLFKNTRRMFKIPSSGHSNSDNSPIEIPGLPTMAITFNPLSHQCLLLNRSRAYTILSIENEISKVQNVKCKIYQKDTSIYDQIVEQPTYKVGNRTLHFILETYSSYYDSETVLFRCLKMNNFQAASKVAMLNGHFSDSLAFQLSALKSYIDKYKLDFTIFNNVSKVKGLMFNLDGQNEIIDSNKQSDLIETNGDLKHSIHIDKVNSSAYLLSSSSSLDSIQQWNDDIEGQGGRESPCNISDIGDIKHSMSQYMLSIKNDYNISPITSVSKLLSESPNVQLKSSSMEIGLSNIKDEKLRKVIELASFTIEFYILKTYATENHILMQNILLKSIEFWLVNNLPVPILESILLENMDKYFYPLSILLFCKNFNNNLGEEIVKKDNGIKHQRPSGFLKEFSTKFCLQLCSMVLENVKKA